LNDSFIFSNLTEEDSIQKYLTIMESVKFEKEILKLDEYLKNGFFNQLIINDEENSKFEEFVYYILSPEINSSIYFINLNKI